MSTNLFKVKKNPRYLNYSVAAAANLNQDVKDWLRDGSAEGLLNINGSDLSDTIAKNQAIFPDHEVTPESLCLLWEKEIINKLGFELLSDESNQLINFMQKYFHQGAFLHIMQTALYEAALKKGYEIRGKNVVSHINIFVQDDALIIQEDTKVKKIHYKDNPEIEVDITDENPYLIIGSITHKVAFDRNNTLSHQITNCDVIYSNKEAENIIDHRSLFRIIIDAFLDLFAMQLSINNLKM